MRVGLNEPANPVFGVDVQGHRDFPRRHGQRFFSIDQVLGCNKLFCGHSPVQALALQLFETPDGFLGFLTQDEPFFLKKLLRLVQERPHGKIASGYQDADLFYRGLRVVFGDDTSRKVTGRQATGYRHGHQNDCLGSH